VQDDPAPATKGTIVQATAAPALDERLIKALAHPLRHRLLAILNERVASPKELAAELGERLPNVSYHVRILADLGCIELVSTTPRRGALEHHYRALMRPFFDDRDWAKLPVSTRRAIFDDNLGHIFQDVRDAARRHGFDDPRTHVSRTPLVLDDRGYDELADLLERTLYGMLEIQAEAAGRMVESGEPGRTTEAVLMHFDKAPGGKPTAKRRRSASRAST
jgi:DNA-binding transcriptional ArsR family regulator